MDGMQILQDAKICPKQRKRKFQLKKSRKAPAFAFLANLFYGNDRVLSIYPRRTKKFGVRSD